MKEAPENGNELLHSAHVNRMNENDNEGILNFKRSLK
jgi:hypothetical protein